MKATKHTVDLTANSGSQRYVLTEVTVLRLQEIQALRDFGMKVAEVSGDGSITLYFPGAEIPPDAEFENVEEIDAIYAIDEIRYWFSISERQVARRLK